MNSIENIAVEYLSPSRTLETILISNTKTQKVFYIYNYEGYFYRFFSSILTIMMFFEEKIECQYYFSTEEELDNFIYNLELI